MKWLLILSFFFTAEAGAQTSAYRRAVDFEWEGIDGAESYEIELKVVKVEGGDKLYNFKTTANSWQGKLRPGKYLMRLRAKDHRRVPGDWSDYSDFIVGLDPVVWKTPKNNATLKTGEEKIKSLKLAWESVPGAKSYALSVYNDQNEKVYQERVTKTAVELKLPVARSYKALVRARAATEVESEKDSQLMFTLLAAPLENVKIQKPENQFVRRLEWEKPDRAENFQVEILKYDPAKKKFEAFKSFENYQETKIDFPQDWAGGVYRLKVQAKATLVEPSKTDVVQFKVRNGDRSPASEYQLTMKQSIDRIVGWYGLASYLITQIDYANANADSGTATSYKTLGGTGRIGVGYLSPKSAWGFNSILDHSGFLLGGKAHTFSSLELSGVYRLRNLSRSEVRLLFGPYYKEIPETIGTNNSLTGASPDEETYDSQKISVVGPHIGAEYWYSLTPRLGFQINAHLYYSMAKVSTPNNQPINPSLSTQLGLLGSYKLSKKWTGLIGYTYRKDEIHYKKDEASAIGTEIPENFTSVGGNYLNFYCEYEF